MGIIFKVFSGLLVLWSSIYAISFAASEIKHKRSSGGVVAFISVAVMIWAYIKGIGL